MLTDTEIGQGVAAVDAKGQLALANLVRRSARFRGYAAEIATTIKDAVTAGTAITDPPPSDPAPTFEQLMAQAKAKALGAVLIKLRGIPGLVVESEGTDKRRTHFTTPENWEELAQDVIMALYDDPTGYMTQQLFAVVERGVRCYVEDGRLHNDEFYTQTSGPYVENF
jgi:hypothetical protein